MERPGHQEELEVLGCFLSVSAGRAGECPGLMTHQVTRLIFEAPAGQRIDLSHHDLRGLDLSGPDFRHADFSYCNLFRVDLTAADLSGATIKDAILDGVIGLRGE